MKRARETDDETEPRSLDENNRNSSNTNHNAKKRDLYGINLLNRENQQKDVESEKASSNSKTLWDSSHLALGVFDFPWLKDGVMSKTENCFLDFEDKFSASLDHQDGIHFSSEAAYCCYETPETSKMAMETLWQPFESDNGLEIKADDVDCIIWSSLLNKNNHEGKILM